MVGGKERYLLVKNCLKQYHDLLYHNYTDPRLKSQWTIVFSRYSTSALADLVLDFDDYISNLADNMATKFVTAGLDPFQIVTGNMGEIVVLLCTFFASVLI